MRIGIIGVGNIGGTLAGHFVRVGHEVLVSNSRGPQTLDELVAELGPKASAVSAAEAAATGELVVVSVPLGRYEQLPRDGLTGKVVIDTGNYYPDRDGHFEELDSGRLTSSELVQAHLTGARVVKAFNAIYWEHLRDMGRGPADPRRIGIPISSDDDKAKQVVSELIDEIGFDEATPDRWQRAGASTNPAPLSTAPT
jgi:predicted dinucleotide-binding enzyme